MRRMLSAVWVSVLSWDNCPLTWTGSLYIKDTQWALCSKLEGERDGGREGERERMVGERGTERETRK